MKQKSNEEIKNNENIKGRGNCIDILFIVVYTRNTLTIMNNVNVTNLFQKCFYGFTLTLM